MARKARDYKAEYARKQELARQRGFTSSFQERKANAAKRGPYRSIADYNRAKRKADAWSKQHSRIKASRLPRNIDAAELKRYDEAFRISSNKFNWKALAEYLHEQEPELYPDVSDTQFWDSYLGK